MLQKHVEKLIVNKNAKKANLGIFYKKLGFVKMVGNYSGNFKFLNGNSIALDLATLATFPVFILCNPTMRRISIFQRHPSAFLLDIGLSGDQGPIELKKNPHKNPREIQIWKGDMRQLLFPEFLL